MMEWQAIETAPKDGTRVNLSPGPVASIPEAVGYWTDLYGGGWYMKGVGHLNGKWKPTHWSPLTERTR